jgi:hypothetical protein
MSLAWNTRRLLSPTTGGEAPERTAVEYHLRSWRELYDKSILSADRYSSSAGQWVIRGDGHFYTVTVISRPVYAVPQELCVAFDCCTRVEEGMTPVGAFHSEGQPIEEVALDFLALLSVWAREPLMPLGRRRVANQPITDRPQYAAPPRVSRGADPPAGGINGPEFALVLKGMAVAPDETVAAAIGASKFYHAALSQVGFDPSGAYVALVSAIECLAGHNYNRKSFEFKLVEKFRVVEKLLAELSTSQHAEELCTKVREELLRNEPFVWQKFFSFITEHIPSEFWETPDELYPHSSVFPRIGRDQFKSCLRKVYGARSEYVHGGKQFPSYIDFGARQRCSYGAVLELQKLIGQERYLPPFSWFERLTHLVIVDFMLRAFAPDVAQTRGNDLAEKELLLVLMAQLPPNVQTSLRSLTHWTARFLGYSVVNPCAPNREWADTVETIMALVDAGLIKSEGTGLEGSSCLRNREIGEAVGEFVFGVSANPFRGNELLLPKAYESLFEKPRTDGGEGQHEEAPEE